ncbi:hypothetical protein ACEPAI_9164 [Sanghuangporus weigelae]
MHSPQEPVSPSASTPSSGSPAPDDIFSDQIPQAASFATSQQLNLSKRRLASSPSQARDIKARRRDDGAKRSFVAATDVIPREGGRRDELVDVELMEKLKQELGDPFDESDLNR